MGMGKPITIKFQANLNYEDPDAPIKYDFNELNMVEIEDDSPEKSEERVFMDDPELEQNYEENYCVKICTKVCYYI